MNDEMNNAASFEEYLENMKQGYCRVIDEEDEDGPNCMLPYWWK